MHSPFEAERGEVEHGADPGDRLEIVEQLAGDGAERPRVREQLGHLKKQQPRCCNDCLQLLTRWSLS